MPDWNGLGYMQLAGQLSSQRADRANSSWQQMLEMWAKKLAVMQEQKYEAGTKIPLQQKNALEQLATTFGYGQQEAATQQGYAEENRIAGQEFTSGENAAARAAEDARQAAADENAGNRLEREIGGRADLQTSEQDFTKGENAADRAAEDARYGKFNLPADEQRALEWAKINNDKKVDPNIDINIYLSQAAQKWYSMQDPATRLFIGFDRMPDNKTNPDAPTIQQFRNAFQAEINRDKTLKLEDRILLMAEFDNSLIAQMPEKVENGPQSYADRISSIPKYGERKSGQVLRRIGAGIAGAPMGITEQELPLYKLAKEISAAYKKTTKKSAAVLDAYIKTMEGKGEISTADWDQILKYMNQYSAEMQGSNSGPPMVGGADRHL